MQKKLLLLLFDRKLDGFLVLIFYPSLNSPLGTGIVRVCADERPFVSSVVDPEPFIPDPTSEKFFKYKFVGP